MRFKAMDLEAFCSIIHLTLFMILSRVAQIDFCESRYGGYGVDDMNLHAAVSSPGREMRSFFSKA
jgi:hypothetical protein